ncbi:MAG: hypothetical protein H9W81_13805 [Enterococcus sp.]|nr:hypothetical protein [Enterococcus sp.]
MDNVTYNELAKPFSEILEKFDFGYKNTVNNVETWTKRDQRFVTTVDINYITGEVIINKPFLRGNPKRTYKLTDRKAMEMATRAAI